MVQLCEPQTRPRYDSHELPATLAMCAPAVRMAVILASAYRMPDGVIEASHEIYPVLALLARQGYVFRKAHSEHRDHRTAATAEGMDRLGWRYDSAGAGLEFDVIIPDPEWGIVDAGFAFGTLEDSVYRVVPAPWPPDEDDERLAGVIEGLKADAIRNVERRQSTPDD